MNLAGDLAQARAALGRSRLLLPDPVPDDPRLSGRAELGRGEYSIVFAADDPGRVLKLVSSPADYFLYTADDRPRGKHYPAVHADLGELGHALSGYRFHLIEMERLLPLDDDSPAHALAEAMISAYWRACHQWVGVGHDMGRLALYDLVKHPPADLDAGLVAALSDLSDFVEEYQVLPDLLNQDNLMMRSDGTLVFSDPVFIA